MFKTKISIIILMVLKFYNTTVCFVLKNNIFSYIIVNIDIQRVKYFIYFFYKFM